MSVPVRSAAISLGLLAGLVLIVVACSGAPADSPAVSSPASSSPVASPAASVAASSAPPVTNSPAASPSEAPLPDGTFKVVARNFAFSPLSLEVKAGEPFTIVFQNRDFAGVVHDVDIRGKDAMTVVVDQPTTSGGKTVNYEYPKLEAGEYIFICSIHPTPKMTGTLIVN